MTPDVARIRDAVHEYVGPPVAHAVIAELIALSVVEHTHAPGVRIRAELTGQHSGVVTDTGRGMRLAPDRGDTIAHAERALTSFHPVRPADADVEAALRDWCWGERGSLGPIVANALCARFVFESSRDGVCWRQEYVRGVPDGPARFVGATTAHGTVVRFALDPALAPEPLRADILEEQLSRLRAAIPDVDLA